jgi:voltage-gated potassium channel
MRKIVFFWLLLLLWVSVTIFTLEYLARIVVSPRKAKYIFSFWGLVDAVSILPTFLGAVNLTFLKAFRELRILRMLRIMRLVKISRSYIKSQDKAKSEAEFNRLNVVIYFMTLFSMTIILASVLYALEHAQHAYSSIPLAMIQSAKILVGGLGQAQTMTLAGEITIIVGRFIGLALFGLLIAIIGGVLHQLLFGSSTKK